jgi:hypothetical protein
MELGCIQGVMHRQCVVQMRAPFQLARRKEEGGSLGGRDVVALQHLAKGTSLLEGQECSICRISVVSQQIGKQKGEKAHLQCCQASACARQEERPGEAEQGVWKV